MARTSKTLFGIALATLGLAALSGCSTSSSSESASASPSPYLTTLDVTTINGIVPPGKLLPLQDVVTLIDTTNSQGNHLVVTRGTRKAGTRVAIHTHKYGGHTCVLSGTITDYVDGHEPMVWPAGTCYYMPANTLMSADNEGTEDAVLLDSFTVPQGEALIDIREPGWPNASTQSEPN